MFGSLGLPELVLIFVVALLLFGPRQLPQIGRSIGRALGEFRRASNDFKRTIEEEVASEEIRDVQRELKTVGSEGSPALGSTESSPGPSAAVETEGVAAPGTPPSTAAPESPQTEMISERPEGP